MSKTANTPGYIVELEGGGDIYAYLVDKEAWDWVNEGGTPFDALVKATAKSEQISEEEALQDLTQIRDDNDRAMRIGLVAITECDSSAQAQREATSRGMDVKGEYQGYSY